MAQPAYDGIRILDFTQVVSGPLATQLLGASGAQVIKVEPPVTGDSLRAVFKTTSQADDEDSGAFVATNRGKESVVLNLKDAAGKDAALRIAAQCDVVIENFRPGVMKRLGLGYEAVKALRPDIIYCSVSGYGQNGPLSSLAAYDGGIQAASGMMSTTGHPDTGPVRTGFLGVDTPTALLTAFAISSGLLRRERTGQGQYIDVSMLDTALVVQIASVSQYFRDGTTNGPRGNQSPAKSPLADTFKTKDGFLSIAMITPKHGQPAMRCLGLPESHWDDFMNAPVDSAQAQEISTQIRETLASQTNAHWLEKLSESGGPVMPVNSIPEAVDLARQQNRPLVDKKLDQAALGCAFVTDADGPVSAPAAPALGENTDKVLREFGFSSDEIDQLKTG